jgi:hypothetical protein
MERSVTGYGCGRRFVQDGLPQRPLGRSFGAFPIKMIVDPSWLADPLSITVLNAALAFDVLWVGGFWE